MINNQNRKLLFLAANPRETSRLRLDEEIREIEAGLKQSQNRDQFILEQRWAVRPRDIRRAMLNTNPQIVHFSGHGIEDEGLVFEDEAGNGTAKLVIGKALAGLFKLFAEQIECVVLNGCYTKEQAEVIAKHIPYVIGMSQAIGDKAAIEFAVGFYDALGAGRSVEFAYKFGCSAIQLAGITEHLTPVLMKSAKITASAKDRPLKSTNQLSRRQRIHLEDERESLQKQYDLWHQKLRRLRQALVIETDEATIFKLEKQIERVQLECERIAQRLKIIDNKLY